MPGAFHGINLAANALRAFQRAIDSSGHNIANVNTRGYSRQAIDFSTIDAVGFYDQGGRHLLGSGVSVASLTRIRDQFVESRMRQALGGQGRFQSLAAGLSEIERTFNEPSEHGISAALNKFFDSWSGLASSPSEPALRLQLRTAGQTLSSRIRSTFHQINAFQSQLYDTATATIQQVNQLASRIGALNARIREATSAGGSPNDLMDQRDTALQDLSALINITTETFSDGTVSVYVTQFALVDAGGARTYPSQFDPYTQTVTDGTRTFDVRGGKLLGLFQSIQNVEGSKAQLDLIANTLRTQINTLHRTGIAANGATGIDFFNDDVPQTGAIDFGLSAAITSSADNIASGTSGNAGDGGLALSLSNMRNSPLGALGNKGFIDFYNFAVTQVAEDTASFAASLETQNSIINQIEEQRQSISGVSLDDEMATMVQFQRSYQAAAKVLTILDQVTEDLIGMIRR